MNTNTNAAVFKFNSNEVRTVASENGDPMFCAADVCAVLGYRNSRDAVAKHCKAGGVAKRDTPTESGMQELTFITEGNLYRLIVKSRKPEAEAFESWVMDEVLPSIRKTGEYRVPYTTGPRDILTAAQAEQLRTTLKIACDKLPQAKRAGFMIKAWSRMKSHFGVTYRNIPQCEFTEALSLAGRHAAEWELVDAPKLAAPVTPAERRQLLVERDGRTTIIDAADKSLIRADLVHALRRDFAAISAATQELNRRMRICFGEVNASDLGAPLTVALDQSAFARSAA